MRRHGRQAGGVETGFISCIRDGDLFALGGDEAVAALKKYEINVTISGYILTQIYHFHSVCASKNLIFHFYCEIFAMQ